MLLGSPNIRAHGVKGKMLSPLLVGGGADPALPAMVPRPSLLEQQMVSLCDLCLELSAGA